MDKEQQYWPAVEGGTPVKWFRFGDYRAVVVADLKSLGRVEYLYVMPIFKVGTDGMCLCVASEKNRMYDRNLQGDGTIEPGESHFLGLFPGHGHLNLGSSNDWADLEKFTVKALEVARHHLHVEDDAIEELKHSVRRESRNMWNPLITIWLEPRKTIAVLSKECPTYLVYPLAAVYGIILNLNKIYRNGVSPDYGFHKWAILGINIIVGAAFGIGLLQIFSFLLSKVGMVFGGSGSPGVIRTALAWSAVPYIPMLLLFLAFTILGPSSLLIRDGGTPFEAVAGTPWDIGTVLYTGLRGILSIWVIVIGIVGLSEVSDLSIARSIATYLIVGIIATSVLMVVMLAIMPLF